MRVTRRASYLIVIFCGPGTTVGKRPGGEDGKKKKKPPRRGSGETGTERGAAQRGQRLGAAPPPRLQPRPHRPPPPPPRGLPRSPCPRAAAALPRAASSGSPGSLASLPAAPYGFSPPPPPPPPPPRLPPPCCRRASPRSMLCLRGRADGAARRCAGCGPASVPGKAGREGRGPRLPAPEFPGCAELR